MAHTAAVRRLSRTGGIRLLTFDGANLQGFRIDAQWTLHHPRGREAPCLRVLHSPSPMALMPVLLLKRCKVPVLGRQGIAMVRSF